MTRIALVSSDDRIEERVRSIATRLGAPFREVPTPLESGAAGLGVVLEDQPNIVVFGPESGVETVREWTEMLGDSHPGITVIWVAEPEPDMWRSALQAGARDVLPPMATTYEIYDSLVRAIDLQSRRIAPQTEAFAAPEVTTGRMITVVSPKGGSGKTMLSTNLAYGLHQQTGEGVVLVDLDLQFGDVAPTLRLRPEYSVLHGISAVGDPTAVKTFLTPHPAGFYVLAAPSNPAEADGVDIGGLAKLLDLLRNEFPYVVVDTGAGISDVTLTGIEQSSDVIFVTSTDLAAVESLRKAVVILDQLGMRNHRRWYMLNRADARVGLTQSDIETATGLTVDVAMPSSRAVPTAMNQGSPVLADDPRGPMARSLNDVVERFLPDYAAGRHGLPPSKGWLKKKVFK